MALTINIYELDEEELNADTSTGRLDRDYTRRLVAYVTGSSAAEVSACTAIDICLAQACPRRFDPWGPADLGSLCIKLDVAREPGSGGKLWNITAHYSTQFGDRAAENQAEDNPLLRPAKWRYASQRQQRTLPFDSQGTPWQNAAEDPFQSPPKMSYTTSRYTITRNEATFLSTLADTYANCVNSDTWYGYGAGAVLCESIDAEEVYEGEYHYFAVTYVIHVDAVWGWQPIYVENKGYRYKDGGEYTNTNNLVWLNDAGGLWESGTDDEAEKYLERYPWFTAALSNLNL